MSQKYKYSRGWQEQRTPPLLNFFVLSRKFLVLVEKFGFQFEKNAVFRIEKAQVPKKSKYHNLKQKKRNNSSI